MIPELHHLQKFGNIEVLTQAGFVIYPITASEQSVDLLKIYHEETDVADREKLEYYIILSKLFHKKEDACNAYLTRRKELTQGIEKFQSKLQKDAQPSLESELKLLEESLLDLDVKTARSLWMADSEMQVHRDNEGSGFTLPPIWNRLVTLIRQDYCRFTETIYSRIQMAARTVGGCDEFRFDMLRYVTCLLKYYGFSCTKQQITFEGKGSFSYMLLNPTWEDLEDEVRKDLKSIDLKDELLPKRYPDTPQVDPSPLKDSPAVKENALFFATVGYSLKKLEGYVDKPFF